MRYERNKISMPSLLRQIGQPSGEITQYEYIAEPKEITITGVSIEQGCKGEKRKYYIRNSSFCAEDIFGTIEQATARCAERIAEKADENLKQRDVKGKVSKTYTWNAGYHMRGIKTHSETLNIMLGWRKSVKEEQRPL